MKFQKIISIICILLVTIILFTACSATTEEPLLTDGGQTEETTTEKQTSDDNDTNKDGNENINKGECSGEHDYEEKSRVEAMALKDGEITYVCSICQDEKKEIIPATKTVKILSLGNSFTDDSISHLWQICKDGGVENVIVANLFKGNCTLDTHWSNLSNNKAAYTYKKNANGSFVNTAETKAIDALKDEEWDFIIIHQASGSSGIANTFTKLDNIIDYINKNKTNPDAKIIWHMTWAYQSDSTHSEFSKYDKNQLKELLPKYRRA